MTLLTRNLFPATSSSSLRGNQAVFPPPHAGGLFEVGHARRQQQRRHRSTICQQQLRQWPGESHQPVTDTLNELVAEEQRELRRFLRAHPCPTKSAITAWAQKVFEGSPMGEAGERLRCALADSKWPARLRI